MRILLIFAVLVGLGYLAVDRYGSRLGLHGSGNALGSLTGKKAEAPAPPPQPAPPAVAPVVAPPSVPVSSPLSNQPEIVPLVSAVCVFKHRPVPKRDQLQALLSSGGGRSAEVTTALIVDEAANAVLMRGPAESVSTLKGAIEQLDVEALEAFCDAWILFVRGDRVRDFEAAFEYGSGTSFGASLSSDGFGVSVPLGLLRGRLDVLASNGVLEVVDRPQLRLSSGSKAEVSTGDEIPFPSTVVSNGIAQTSITFKRVGLSFGVKPLFLDGHRVRLDVDAENGLVGATQKIGDIEVPSISKQAVTATATLGFDEAMVIGGLESVRREKRFGLLGQKERQQAGRLYVAIMLRSGYPKARPVIGPGPGLGIDVPGVTGGPGKFDDQVLPFKGWVDSPDGKPTVGLPLPEK